MKIKVMSKLGNVRHVAGGCDSPRRDLLIDGTAEQRKETEIAMYPTCTLVFNMFFFSSQKQIIFKIFVRNV